ncbi:alpha/beta fold hydrolase [Paenibacillus sp. GCM10027626]|uniref:alpha/beta fold hydrolase n=1 Tax=Paenibacillus sp. GCM10027626 TaxID=3273411 RepID=UPI003625D2DE
MIKVILHDGNTIDVEIRGEGPAILLPVNPVPVEGAQADELKKWGVDPALGKSLIDGLCDHYRVIAFDYEGHVMQQPKPDSLTPDNVARDFIAVADAAGAPKFAYYGYSWLALSGLQLAIRTNRLSTLIMGGFPPIGGPYQEMLQVTKATHEMSIAGQSEPTAQEQLAMNEVPEAAEDYDWSNVQVTMNEGQTKQFVTLYEHLQHFDDSMAQAQLTCPRLCFAGSIDRIEYGEQWGNVTVDIAGSMIKHHSEISNAGWDVQIVPGLDHTGAMQPANVLPVLRPWLDSVLQ